MILNALERRIIDLSYAHKLSHISSCLNCVNLIAEIYARMQPNDIVVLGAGHASLAHFVVLESLGKCDAEEMIDRHGVHSSRDPEHGIIVSNGSLGQSETVACGLALADPNRTVWLVTSDGSCAEGSVYEAMRVARKHCPNLKAFVVFNGLGAYGPAGWERTENGVRMNTPKGMTIIKVNDSRYPKFLQGLAGHYTIISEDQYTEFLWADAEAMIEYALEQASKYA